MSFSPVSTRASSWDGSRSANSRNSRVCSHWSVSQVLPLLALMTSTIVDEIHSLSQSDAQRLEHERESADRDHVVDELERQTRSQGADVPDAASHGLEHGMRLVEDSAIAPHHDRESAELRDDGAAAHRSIQQADPRPARFRAEVADRRRQNGAHAENRRGRTRVPGR